MIITLPWGIKYVDGKHVILRTWHWGRDSTDSSVLWEVVHSVFVDRKDKDIYYNP